MSMQSLLGSDIISYFGESAHMWFVLLVVAGTVVSYASEKISLELTSIIALAVLLLFFFFVPLAGGGGEKILTTERLLSGFSNPALVTVLCLLILGQAIVQTGALNEVANVIIFLSRSSKFIAIALTLFVVIVVSAFLNNTPVIVIFIPIMAALARGLGISASKVMIPLSFASILGGMMTLIGSSTNLLVSGIMQNLGMRPLTFFEFAFPGMIIAGVGFVYLMFIAPLLLKDRSSLVKGLAGDGDEEERQFIAQFEVSYDSELIGNKPDSESIKGLDGLDIRMIQRGEHAFLPPFDEEMVLRPRDIIIVSAPRKSLLKFFSRSPDGLNKHMAMAGEIYSDEEDVDLQEDMHIAEIIVSPASRMIGQNLEKIGFHRQYSCVVLGIQRQSRMIRARMTETRLAAGDVLLVMGKSEDILALQESRDLLLLEWSTEELHWGKKAGRAALIFSAVVGLAALNIVPIVVGAMAGVAAVLVTGCLNLRQAVRSLDVKIVLIISTSIAMGVALQETGGAAFIAHNFVILMDGASPIVVMSSMFFLVAVVTNILSNNASAVLFTPIAIGIANEINVDPMMFVYAVIFAANCSFATPIGYQTNLMVMGPGHYTFSDYLRSGVPLAIVVWLSYVVFAMWFYGV